MADFTNVVSYSEFALPDVTISNPIWNSAIIGVTVIPTTPTEGQLWPRGNS